MARQPDPPGLQALKGNPGKREKTVKARDRAARKAAKALAEAPAERADPMAPPKFLDKRFAAAVEIWRTLEPKLSSTHRLQATHRLMFATYCVYASEWVACTEDIKENGYTQAVETIAGGSMERIRPAVKMREIAFSNMRALAANFGLTPGDEYGLFKDQRIVAMHSPDLFGAQVAAQALDLEEDEADADQVVRPQARSLIGVMGSMDSAPPGSKPN